MTDTNNYLAQADACQSVTTLRRMVHELAADLDEHAALNAETDAGISQIELERDEAVRRADALERALRDARPLVEKWCHYQGDHPKLFQQYLGPIDAALTDQPAQEWTAERAQAYIDQFDHDQPAQDGEPSVDQARFERVWQQLVYSLADFFALEVTDAQARSIAREVLQAADAGDPSCCARTREECAQVADAYPEHEPFGADYTAHGLIGEGQDSASRDIAAAIRRTGDTGGGDE
jgi:hypothetical protein